MQMTIEAVGPQMRSAMYVNQLGGDSFLSPRLTHRTFDDIADAQFASNLCSIEGAPLVRETRAAGDHDEPADAGQRRDDLRYDSLGEVILLRVATQIGEGPHRD